MLRKSIAVVLLMSIMLSGCSYMAHKDYYSSLDEYTQIWELTGFRHGYDGISPFFPKNIKSLAVKSFYCRYDEQFPLGEGVQVYLEIQFANESLFGAELERLASLATDCSANLEETNFISYATHLGENYSSEYALADEEQLVIYYIYLQNLPREEVQFDPNLLPTGYTGYGEIVYSD